MTLPGLVAANNLSDVVDRERAWDNLGSSVTTPSGTITVKGKDILALNGVSSASARDFILIKDLTSAAQSRITIAAQNAASGTVLRDAALLRNAPSSVGEYYASRGVFDGGTLKINGIQAASLSSSPFSGSTALFPISIRTVELSSNFRLAASFPSGTIASPERALPVETTSLVLYAKAGQS
jgi:hypothetical protein